MALITREELETLWTGRYVENWPDEMLSLIKEMETVNPLTTIIEIGVRTCGTFRLWERLVPAEEGMVIGVDCSPEEELLKFSGVSTKTPQLMSSREVLPDATFWNRMPSSSVYEENCTEDCLDLEASDRQLHFAIGESTSIEVHNKIAEILGDRQADFIFHDGCHSGDVPLKDFDNIIQPFLRSGGLFALADVGDQISWRINDGTLALCKRLSNGQTLPAVKPSIPLVNRAGIALWRKP